METIRLVGGPADGRVQAWDGGDWLRVHHRPDMLLPPPVLGEEEPIDVSFDTYWYRRSGVSKQLFVFQP